MSGRPAGSHGARPPVFFLAALVIQLAAHYTIPLRILVPRPLSFAGVLFLVLGFLLVIPSARSFDRAHTAIE